MGYAVRSVLNCLFGTMSSCLLPFGLLHRFAGGLLLVNPIVLVKRGWKGLHEKGGVVGVGCQCDD